MERDAQGRPTGGVHEYAWWSVLQRHQSFPSSDCPPGSPGRVTVSGVKYILDGTPVERRAVQREVYADRPGETGTLNFPTDSLAVFLDEGLSRNEQVLLHAVGDSAVGLVLATMQRLAPASPWRPPRVRIELGDGLTADDCALARELGVVLVQNGTHCALGPLAKERFQSGRLVNYQPWASAERAGIPVALGSDGMPSVFLHPMFAVIHPNNSAEAMSMEGAVRAYTSGGARAEGTEQDKGRLLPGMFADFAMLSADIFTLPPNALPSTAAVMTVVGGVVAYEVEDASSRR